MVCATRSYVERARARCASNSCSDEQGNQIRIRWVVEKRIELLRGGPLGMRAIAKEDAVNNTASV